MTTIGDFHHSYGKSPKKTIPLTIPNQSCSPCCFCFPYMYTKPWKLLIVNMVCTQTCTCAFARKCSKVRHNVAKHSKFVWRAFHLLYLQSLRTSRVGYPWGMLSIDVAWRMYAFLKVFLMKMLTANGKAENFVGIASTSSVLTSLRACTWLRNVTTTKHSTCGRARATYFFLKLLRQDCDWDQMDLQNDHQNLTNAVVQHRSIE